MKTKYSITGMACNHCRRAVETALNGIQGATAVVTLDPPVAEIESAAEIPAEEIRSALAAAGDYTAEKM